MTEYAPLFRPGEDVTFNVADGQTVTAGTLVDVTGDREITTAGANSDSVLGVALFDGAAGDKVTVATAGVHRLAASGQVSAGDSVSSAASGAVATTSTGSVVGIAISDSTGGAGSTVDVLLVPSGAIVDSDTVYTLPAATGAALGGVKQAANQADSTATDVAGLVADFNGLLAKLKAAGIMAPDA